MQLSTRKYSHSVFSPQLGNCSIDCVAQHQVFVCYVLDACTVGGTGIDSTAALCPGLEGPTVIFADANTC